MTDTGRAEAFAGRMLGLLNDSFTGFMVSVGHRTGLFDAMAKLAPSTSAQIATAAKLRERYVREWLGGMTVAKIVEYDPAAGTYRLPPEHAGITRAAGPDNLAMFTQYLSLLGNVENDLVRCFKKGGGVPYSKFARFQELQSEESRPLYDTQLSSAILPLAPGLVDRLRSGIDVADVGTGQGHAVVVMARAFPQSRFVGYDFSREGVAAGKKEARGLKNARFEVRDIAKLADRAKFDLITAFDAIHDLAKPAKALTGIARALKPGGTFLMMDIASSSRLEENLEHPFGPIIYAASTFHCMTVSLSQKGEGLGTAWGRQKACAMLTAAGFSKVDFHQLPGDPFHAFYVSTK